MIWSIFILVAVLCVVCLSALFAVALGRAASHGDADLDDRLRRARATRELELSASRQSYAGLVRIQGATSPTPPSTTGPLGHRQAGIQRSRASSLTMRRPRMRVHTPTGGARP